METDGSDSVERLVNRLRDGDPTPSMLRVADRVLRRAEPAARKLCRREARGLPPPVVDELVQQTLELVWQKMAEFELDGRPFEAWVRGIARNVCRNARKRKRDLLTEDGVLDATDPGHGALRVLQREERNELLTAAIEAGLQGIEQDVFFHRYCHDLSRERIAEILGLADANEVRVVLIRARRHLRTAILGRLEALGHGESLLRSEDR